MEEGIWVLTSWLAKVFISKHQIVFKPPIQGIRYFGGGPAIKMPSRWNHVCGAIEYKEDNNAKRTIYADGKENFVFTSKYLDEVKWKLGHNFTFGVPNVQE